jgi:glycosyltransferase involved in cell wall biosynthesis
MNVLLVFSSSELGGAERSLTRMALASTGEIEYSLATLDGHGPWVDWCREIGGSPLVLGERTTHDAHGRFGFKTLRRLATLVRRERYAVLYVIGLRASLWVRLMRPWLAGARLVHGIRWNPDSNSRLDRAFRVIERLLGGLIDLYICNSRVAAETLVRRAGIPPGKACVIYNGLEKLPMQPGEVVDRPQRVVVLANLNPRKGHTEFLDVVAAVCIRQPRAHFVFVGRDDMDGHLVGEIARRGLAQAITLTGYQADVGGWLSDARLMVLPSLWGEGCPTAILEGYSHGLPVVAYAIDGIPELIADGVDGFVVPLRDTVALTDAVLRILDNPEQAARMGAAGRAKIVQKFTLVSCASLHAAAFSELAVART